jgi:hypothetical protein
MLRNIFAVNFARCFPLDKAFANQSTKWAHQTFTPIRIFHKPTRGIGWKSDSSNAAQNVSDRMATAEQDKTRDKRAKTVTDGFEKSRHDQMAPQYNPENYFSAAQLEKLNTEAKTNFDAYEAVYKYQGSINQDKLEVLLNSLRAAPILPTLVTQENFQALFRHHIANINDMVINRILLSFIQFIYTYQVPIIHEDHQTLLYFLINYRNNWDSSEKISILFFLQIKNPEVAPPSPTNPPPQEDIKVTLKNEDQIIISELEVFRIYQDDFLDNFTESKKDQMLYHSMVDIYKLYRQNRTWLTKSYDNSVFLALLEESFLEN